MQETLRELADVIGKSGFVGYPLVAGALALWYALGYRCVLVFAGDRRGPRSLVAAAAAGTLGEPRGLLASAARRAYALVGTSSELGYHLDEVLFDYRRDLSRLSSVATSVVRIAPLLGLLGTVTGMIETFDNLGDTSGLNAGAGVAGGISEALYSTQLGLIVAVPGLLLGRLLDQRAQRIDDDLTKLRDIMVAEHDQGETP